MVEDAPANKVIRDACRQIVKEKAEGVEQPSLSGYVKILRTKEMAKCSECGGTGEVRRNVGWSTRPSTTIGISIEYENVPCPKCRRDEHASKMTGVRGGPDWRRSAWKGKEG